MAILTVLMYRSLDKPIFTFYNNFVLFCGPIQLKTGVE